MYIKWKRVSTSGATSDEWQRMTTNDNEWQQITCATYLNKWRHARKRTLITQETNLLLETLEKTLSLTTERGPYLWWLSRGPYHWETYRRPHCETKKSYQRRFPGDSGVSITFAPAEMFYDREGDGYKFSYKNLVLEGLDIMLPGT